MFFVQFEGTPRRDARTGADAAGAYINCWIERPTLGEAVSIARSFIEAQGWIIDQPDEAYPVDEQTYPPGKDGREYFVQALIDREVYVFYQFPEVDLESTGG
jgi:hypothetical protein